MLVLIQCHVELFQDFDDKSLQLVIVDLIVKSITVIKFEVL